MVAEASRSLSCSAVAALLGFVVPLACVNWIKDCAEQIVDAGIVRSAGAAPDDPPHDGDAALEGGGGVSASAMLASFGVCWYICTLATAISATAQQATLVLGQHHSGRRNVLLLYGAFALLAALVFCCIGLVPSASTFVFVTLHDLTDERARKAANAMIVLMAGFPLLETMKKYFSGILSRQKRTVWVTVGAIANVGGIFVSTALLILYRPTQRFVGADSIAWYPVAGLYTGIFCDTFVVFMAARCGAEAVSRQGRGDAKEETLYQVTCFSWPLALRELTMGISRPLINLWVARDGDTGTEELAVLIVVYPFIHVAYGWLNELKNVAPAFKDDQAVAEAIKPFYYLATGFSLSLMVLFGWLPVGAWILTDVTGVQPELVAQCIGPMRLFTLWPPAVALRSYCQGMALCERRTGALAPAGPLRVVAIATTLGLFTVIDGTSFSASLMPRAAMVGTIALCMGFWTEALASFFLLQRHRARSVRKAMALELEAEQKGLLADQPDLDGAGASGD